MRGGGSERYRGAGADGLTAPEEETAGGPGGGELDPAAAADESNKETRGPAGRQ